MQRRIGPGLSAFKRENNHRHHYTRDVVCGVFICGCERCTVCAKMVHISVGISRTFVCVRSAAHSDLYRPTLTESQYIHRESKKTRHQTLGHNFNYYPIFKIFFASGPGSKFAISYFTTHSPVTLPVKEFLRLVNIWRSYKQNG